MRGSRCNGQWDGILRDDRTAFFFSRDLEPADARLPCGGGDCCAALSGRSKPRQITHWPREEQGTDRASLNTARAAPCSL